MRLRPWRRFGWTITTRQRQSFIILDWWTLTNTECKHDPTSLSYFVNNMTEQAFKAIRKRFFDTCTIGCIQSIELNTIQKLFVVSLVLYCSSFERLGQPAHRQSSSDLGGLSTANSACSNLTNTLPASLAYGAVAAVAQ